MPAGGLSAGCRIAGTRAQAGSRFVSRPLRFPGQRRWRSGWLCSLKRGSWTPALRVARAP